jgi:hypothetical protein
MKFVTLHSIDRKLDVILSALSALTKGESQMDADIQKLIDQAKANTNAEAAAIGAINDLATKLSAALAGATSLSAADRQTLQQEVTDMQTSAAAIGSAIVAGDPTATGLQPTP